jgi:hypothetical protein
MNRNIAVVKTAQHTFDDHGKHVALVEPISPGTIARRRRGRHSALGI